MIVYYGRNYYERGVQVVDMQSLQDIALKAVSIFEFNVTTGNAILGKGVQGAMVSFVHSKFSASGMFYEAWALAIHSDSGITKSLFSCNRLKCFKGRA